MKDTDVFRPNFTIIGLPFLLAVSSIFVLYYIFPTVYNILRQIPNLTETHIATLIAYSIPIVLMTIFLYHAIKLFAKIYIITFTDDNTVKFTHITGLTMYSGPKNELIYSKNNLQTVLNDPWVNISTYHNFQPINLNWLKGRLIFETPNRRTITIPSFGYDNFSTLRQKLLDKNNNA